MSTSALPVACRARQPLLIAWLALCVLVVQGLLPLAQARMALPDSLATSDTSDLPDPAAAHARCWACGVLAQAAVALPPPPIALLALTSGAGVPPMVPAGAEPRPTRGLAAPRAPPNPS
jgi:hypothetical protein